MPLTTRTRTETVLVSDDEYDEIYEDEYTITECRQWCSKCNQHVWTSSFYHCGKLTEDFPNQRRQKEPKKVWRHPRQ